VLTGLATFATLMVLGAGGVAEHWQLSYTLGSGVVGCPSEAEIREGISARLGHDPFAPTASSRVSMAVEQVAKQLRGRVLLERGPEEKIREQQFTSGVDECKDLASAMELAVAIAIDPMSLMRFGPPPPPPGAAVPGAGVAAAVPPPTPLPPSKPAASPTENNAKLKTRLILGGDLSIGVQPEVGGGLSLEFEVQWKRLIVGLEADVLFPATGALSPFEIQTSLIGGKLLACGDLGVLGACAVLWAAAEHADILGADLTAPSTHPMLALGARAFRDQPLSARFFLRGQVDILVPVNYSPLQAQDGTIEWNRPPLSLTLGLGVGWRLP
jgi:hypothetical protein